MPAPIYPTEEGIWAGGVRTEPGADELRLGFPYPEAVENFRKAVEGRADFDPATLLVWGTMQATGVLNILKAVESAFGAEGQQVVRRALNDAGREAMAGLLENSLVPGDVDEMIAASFLVTGMNTIIYASLERPWVTSPERSEFDILWCPHQDRYTAFDCRVQRYFVEGMIGAVDDAGYPKVTAWVEQLIPHGADCCHFVVEKRGEGTNPWHIYTEELQAKAFEKLEG
ncbi:MAG: L-2-amino-thiazoline-4-carboxylic acid hydrolase [Acidimicrobiia bacterium]|nr:L-2-amino-thiazoline-4-carboxylic acid hydrolase [Acidimicrobiia bacterium]